MFARPGIKSTFIALAAIAIILSCRPAVAALAGRADNAAASASECLIVYPLDQISSGQDAHYLQLSESGQCRRKFAVGIANDERKPRVHTGVLDLLHNSRD